MVGRQGITFANHSPAPPCASPSDTKTTVSHSSPNKKTQMKSIYKNQTNNKKSHVIPENAAVPGK